MFRYCSFVLSISLLAVGPATRAGDVANGVGTQLSAADDVRVIDKLDDGLKISQQAKTFDAMVGLVKPRLFWRNHDVLWTVRNEANQLSFVMNRAYNLRIGHNEPACYLLESHDYRYEPDGSGLIYTRSVDDHPLVVAHDPVRGVIYQARWESVPASGSGSMTETRNIFFLCDGEHRWHFIDEGPVGETGQLGVDERYSDAVEVDAKWTADPAHPVKLSYTLVTTDSWEHLGENHQSVSVRRRMVPGLEHSPGFYDGFDAADYSPGQFKREGPNYVVASTGESLDAFVQRLFHSEMDWKKTKNEKDKFIEAAAASLRQTNPSLTTDIVKGEIIILPEKMWQHGGID
jgi:hypothetical protein